ncbi:MULTISPECIES: hypothetical protein [unclassified Pseudomonas]|uniref:hypothetical protein n=1 Tax=unclassified Pseudomonas TaxID=196821 RepID=UPI000A1F6BBC|nr:MULTISPECIES: hypothetical protein [unclassified Pseudomonas]
MPTETQNLDDAATENNERELSRRSWFDEAQRLKRENEGLRSEVKRLDLMVAQADYNYDMDRAQFKRQLAERDALLVAATRYIGNSVLLAQIKAALDASAEPKSCGACAGCEDGCRVDCESPQVERDERAPCQHPNVVPRSQIVDGKFLGYFCKDCNACLGTDRAALERKPTEDDQDDDFWLQLKDDQERAMFHEGDDNE